MFLPDEQVVRLLFWVEGTGGKAPEGGERKEKRTNNTSSGRENQKKEGSVIVPGIKMGSVLPQESTTTVLPEESTISIGYIVSVLQYPRLYFTVPQRDVWLSAYFHHDVSSTPPQSFAILPLLCFTS